MSDPLNTLIAALREELQQYGEMLARLDEQQERVMRREADDLLQSVDAVQAQGLTIQKARRFREQCQSEVARGLCLPDDAPFSQSIPLLPADYQPLVQALVQENNELLQRVQQRARQNHLLLARSLEMMQQFLRSFLPSNHGPVYNDAGSVFRLAIQPRQIYEAVG